MYPKLFMKHGLSKFATFLRRAKGEYVSQLVTECEKEKRIFGAIQLRMAKGSAGNHDVNASWATTPDNLLLDTASVNELVQLNLTLRDVTG